jgi:hypothetical protein
MNLNSKKITVKTTNSCSYFLPLLHRVVGFKYIPFIANSYIWNNETDRQFCVLYKFSGTKEFLKYEGKLMEHDLYIGHEDYDDHVLYKFHIPSDLKWIVTQMMERRINMLDEESKKLILSFNVERLVNTEVIKDVLDGKFLISKTYMKDETFSNFLRDTEVLDANQLYKRIKNE